MNLVNTVMMAMGLILFWSKPAGACLHPGKDFSSSPVTQSAQQALILHDGKTEELILSVQYHSKVAVDSLAWIVPVPSAPTEYGTADSKLFTELHRWGNLRRGSKYTTIAKGTKRSLPPKPKSSLRLLAPATVGPYLIQPIQASGVDALPTLNQWMSDHGFSPLSEEGLRYYLERNWTFLAIKILPSSEDGNLSVQATLPPLRVRFPSEKAIFPLKFSTHMGEFDVQIYLISNRAYSENDFNGARDRGFEVVSMGTYYTTARFSQNPLSARSRIQSSTIPKTMAPLIRNLFGEAEIYLSVLVNERINAEQKPTVIPPKWSHAQFLPANWAEDLSIPGLDQDEKLLGTVLSQTPFENDNPLAEKDSTNHPQPKEEISTDKSCATTHVSLSWEVFSIFALVLFRRRVWNLASTSRR
ncbi:MAG: DUF2330 domain-containing protein [Myxococcota bacterium]|nr:DUF2330 domain-containing protein [Myxococcota bacterium]